MGFFSFKSSALQMTVDQPFLALSVLRCASDLFTLPRMLSELTVLHKETVHPCHSFHFLRHRCF